MASSFYSMVSQIFESIAPIKMQSNDKNIEKKENNFADSDLINKDTILSTNFNQDNTCISVATRNGFRIFQCKPFIKAFECIDNTISCRSVSMLFATSLVALIGSTNNADTTSKTAKTSLRNVKLYNTKNRQELCRLNFKSRVLSVKMNKSRLAVCCWNKIHIFDLINNMKQIHEIIIYHDNNTNNMHDVHSNNNNYIKDNIFDICGDDNNNLLAYPDKSKCGAIGVLDAYNLQKKSIIEAHDSQLQIIQFNADGNYLCSASIMGTLLRIFALPSGAHIYTFRRGTYPSTIYSISFNLSCTLLAVTSNSNKHSIHIFDLQHHHHGDHYSKYKKYKKYNKYIPQSVKSQIEDPRSIICINIKHPIKSIKSIKCGWFNDNSLLCASQNGYFYRYLINNDKNSYKLLSEHSLRDNQYNLHKQQKTKIYKNQKNKKKINKDDKQEKNDNNSDKLGIDDLFDLSDGEFFVGDLP